MYEKRIRIIHFRGTSLSFFFTSLRMVHAGPCEVLVLNAQSQAVNETLLQDGNWYFHATPGETFSVLLRFTSTTNSYGIDPDMMVHLKLDGVQIGFCHCISLSQKDSAKFKGFIKSGKQ